jgi:hypothetical protein
MNKKHILLKNLQIIVLIFLLSAMSIIPLVRSLSLDYNNIFDSQNIEVYTQNSIKHTGDLEYWALLIGVGTYEGHPEMNGPSHLSAEAMKESLLLSEHWQEDHIRIITCDNATKTNIINGFKWLDDNENEDDISLIYIATHGGRLNLFGIPIDFPPIDEADNCDEYLVTYKGFKNPVFSNIRDDELKNLINKLESQGICVIIDTCFSGGFDDTSGKNSFRGNIINPRHHSGDFSFDTFNKEFAEEIKNNGRVILMASQEDEYAYATPQKGHCFTTVLIKSVGDGFGDFDNNGLISAEEAFNFTQYRLGLSSYNKQHPKIYDGYKGELHLTVSRYQIDFFDDCESDIKWTTIDHTGGIGGDLWHLSEKDCTTPTHCWHLGDENTMRYNNYMNNSLLSPNIELGKNPLLTFISRDSHETYDSFYLDISSDNWSTYNTLKLHTLSFWYPQEISLHSNTFGDLSRKTIQIRFRGVSDSSIPFYIFTGKGYFKIDDIQIYSERMVK